MTRGTSCPMAVLCLIGMFGLHCGGPAAASPTKRALLIGIDDYLSSDVTDLRGAVNDVNLMESVLQTRFEFPPENVLVLRNAQATRAGILAAIEQRLITPTQPGDVVVLHYAGHGSQMIDNSHDELDGWDETIVPQDSRTPGVFDISDDEINGLLREISKETPNVTLIFDSCHSGTVTRAMTLGAVGRQAPPDTRTPPAADSRAIGDPSTVEGLSDFALPDASYVLISGARADERSYEIGEGQNRHGALTYFLADALRTAPAGATWRDLMDGIGANVTSHFAEQHPQIEGGRMNAELFGDISPPPPPFALVSPNQDGSVSIEGGQATGLFVGVKIDVYPPGTKRFEGTTRTAQVEVTAVDALRSQGKLVNGGPIGAQSRAALSTVQPGGYRLGVLIESANPTNPSAALLQRVKGKLESYEFVRVDAPADEAQVRLRAVGPRVELISRDLRRLGAVDSTAPDAEAKVVTLVTHWARWFAILSLTSPNPALDVDLKLRRAGDPESMPPPAELEAGKDDLEVEVTNRSGSKLYVVIVSLAESGAVRSIPSQGPAIELSGLPLKKTFKATLREGVAESNDVIKVIAATQPIPTDNFTIDPVPTETARAVPVVGGSRLARLLQQTNLGMARDLDPVDVASWTTRQASLKVVRRSTEAAAVALHFATPEAAAEGRSRGVGRGLPTASALPGVDATLIVQAGLAGGRGTDTIGTTFDKAYELGDRYGSERAEPLLELDLPGSVARDVRDGGRSVSEPDDPRAAASPTWSLEHSRVAEAWERVREKTGRPHGQEARGVAVAHVDTGYRQHPEIWTDDASTRTIWNDAGWDYFGNEADATDDLKDSHPLDNPAHGTGSGSAIASPEGSQTPGYPNGATGAGQGARLVPVRVHRSVVHFSTTRLVQAIDDVSGTDRTHVKAPTDFISLSMGGVPTWSLWRAVQRAEARGYLIIAAAGNYVGTVVWPARFESVLAVGATNVGCHPWSGSSHGAAVDVSAPGESVWRAMLDDDGKHITSMGTGTTYGTASTAGIAALWFAMHRDSQEFKALQDQHAIARVFRHLITKTAWRPGVNTPFGVQCDPGTWRPNEYGAGIVDAAALVEAPLEEPRAPRSVAPQKLGDLPLFSSLYKDTTPADAIRADYRQLFAPTGQDTALQFESEIMHHYVLDRDVAAALDQITVKGDRSESAFAQARAVLRARDLSSRLRSALQ